MVGLSIPEDFPLSNLVAQELTQVCIGAYHVRMNFYRPMASSALQQQWEPGASIDIEAGYEFHEIGVPVQSALNENLGAKAGCLTTLLGQHIVSVERLSENELLLVFSSGSKLQLLTDPVGYESYHIHIDGETVDVTVCK